VKWLIDEMLPPETATELRRRGHDAVSVGGLEPSGQPDAVIFDTAVAHDRVVVTENVADYAVLLDQRLRNNEAAVPAVFVRKADLPRRGGLSVHLAERLHRWAEANPDPYVGPHWL
jgi:hypothetical protein